MVGANLTRYKTGSALSEIVDAASEVDPSFVGGIQKARAAVATDLNVSPRSVMMAEKVREHAIPEVQQAVMDGKLKVSVAEQIASYPAEEQSALLDPEKRKEVLGAKKPSDPFMERAKGGEYNGKAFLNGVGYLDGLMIEIEQLSDFIKSLSMKASTLDDEAILVPLLNRLRVASEPLPSTCTELVQTLTSSRLAQIDKENGVAE